MDDKAAIVLDATHRFAGGYHRNCYIHPVDDDLCVKVSLRGNMRESRREAKYYRHLQRRRVSWECLPRFHGFVETNLGRGAVFDLVRDFDGTVSQTLEHYLRSPALTAADAEGLVRSVEALKEFLMEHRVITRTLKAKNIVYKKTSPEQGRLFLIDNIGHTEFIPIVKYVASFARMKITRKWIPFEQDVLKKLEENDHMGRTP